MGSTRRAPCVDGYYRRNFACAPFIADRGVMLPRISGSSRLGMNFRNGLGITKWLVFSPSIGGFSFVLLPTHSGRIGSVWAHRIRRPTPFPMISRWQHAYLSPTPYAIRRVGWILRASCLSLGTPDFPDRLRYLAALSAPHA